MNGNDHKRAHGSLNGGASANNAIQSAQASLVNSNSACSTTEDSDNVHHHDSDNMPDFDWHELQNMAGEFGSYLQHEQHGVENSTWK